MIWLSRAWMASLIVHLDLPPLFVVSYTRVWSHTSHSSCSFLNITLTFQSILVLFRRKTVMTLNQKSPMLCAHHPSPMMTWLIHMKIDLWPTPCLKPRTRCGLVRQDRIVISIRSSSGPCQLTLSRTGGPMMYDYTSVWSITLIVYFRTIVRRGRPTMSLKEYR